jgi:cell division protein FtsL
MNYLQKIVLILVLVSFAVGSVQAQKKKRKKTATEKKTTSKKKSSNAGKTAVAKPVQV